MAGEGSRGRMLALALGLLAVLAGVAVLVMRRPAPVKDSDAPSPPESTAFTMEEYRRRGGPSPSQAWAPADYENALRALDALSRGAHGHLPREEDPVSGEVFARLVAEENLKQLLADRDVEKRMDGLLQLTQQSKPLLLLYLKASQADTRFNAELARVVAFLLKVSILTLEQAMAFRETLPPQEKNDPVRLQGLAQMQLGMAQQVGGTLLILKDHSMQTPNRRFLARALEEAAARIRPLLTPTYRRELGQTLAAAAGNEADATTREHLEGTRKILLTEDP